MSIITRFAPSPSGLLHLGHAYSALMAWDFAQENQGKFILRIEDIDHLRCKPEFEQALKEDLEWLGIGWDEPTRRQSEHLACYQEAADTLQKKGVLYPCFCTRKEILTEIKRAGAAPHGSVGPAYPGTCRVLPVERQLELIAEGKDHAWRLDLTKSLSDINRTLSWIDLKHGEITITDRDWEAVSDVVLARKDIGTSYHIAVTVDDALQEVSHVVRGKDLFDSTHIHVLLQALLGLPSPTYLHHELICDTEGNRLAKRDKSQTLNSLRASGVTADQITGQLREKF